MDISMVSESPVNERGGQSAYMLLAKGQFGTTNLSVTWVECPPGSEQPLHQHEAQEQVYVIIRGRGVLIVGDEQREVSEGTLISVPKRTRHAIRTASEERMAYVSATSPPFAGTELGAAFAFERR